MPHATDNESPTIEDIWALYQKNPIVNACMRYHLYYDMSLEDALILCIVNLAEQNKRQEIELEHLLSRTFPPVLFFKKRATDA